MKKVRPFLFAFIVPILTVIILVTGCGGGDSGSGSGSSSPAWTWVQLIPNSPPAPRYGHAMVYATGPFMFGGRNRSSKQTLQDTWE